MNENLLAQLPVLLVSGYSGSGKTTLIENLIPMLIADGLAVAVIKHDTHGLHVDRPGKDSDRFFRAGATVFAHGPNEAFLRIPEERAWTLESAATYLLQSHDLILVEGHKQTPIPAKIWLRSESDEPPPPEASNATLDLGRNEPRRDRVYEFLRPWLDRQWRRTPVHVGVLIGGQSSRMKRPKHLMKYNDVSWVERITYIVSEHIDSVVFLGAGELPSSLNGLPRLSDVPDCGGPLAGMRAAMRWDPQASWLFVACDMPLITSESVAWLLERRAPGRWAVLPQRTDSDQVEPLFAWYDFRASSIIEKVAVPRDLDCWQHTFLAQIPHDIQSAWDNINTSQGAAIIR